MTLSVKELAKELETDPHTARRFLRIIMPDSRPDKGGRWAIQEKQVKDLKNKFTAFHTARGDNAEIIELLHEAQHNMELVEARLEALR